jgi:hypothetical protein
MCLPGDERVFSVYFQNSSSFGCFLVLYFPVSQDSIDVKMELG